ncbi:Ribokinase-like protein [Aspergillus pseudoustus]|uniref:Ribokinase-like protein n=1 Tax=Aspergillus pseudoustus TaxID=1810923 RepID=A0ABR4KJS0_9EURO
MSLIAVGACYVDTILTTPHYPGEDDKLRATSISRRRGGNCPNSLEVLQQLVAETPANLQFPLNLVAILPARSSVASQQIRTAFEPHVSLDHCLYREEFEEPASSYIMKSQASGSRTIVNYNELPEMTLEEFGRIVDGLKGPAAWFHFEGRIPDVTLSCIRHLRNRFPDTKVSVEVEKPGREGLQELVEEADVVFYSKTWAQHNGYNSANECVQKQLSLTRKASLLCCTWGQDGAAALETSTRNLVHSPAYCPAGFQVVDTIGAGDTFIAGMLYGLICKKKGWDLSQKLSMANHLAGTKVAQEGFAGLGRVLREYCTT